MNLSSPLKEVIKLSKPHQDAFTRLRIFTVRDLLYNFPYRYSDIRILKLIQECRAGDEVLIQGEVHSIKTHSAYGKIPGRVTATITDLSGSIRVTWFGRNYITKQLTEGETLQLSGTVTQGKDGVYISNPDFEHKKTLAIDSTHSLFQTNEVASSDFLTPMYKEVSGITSKYIRELIAKILTHKDMSLIPDSLPEHIRTELHLPAISEALTYIHFPKTENHVVSAKKRFAFEEIFLIQIERALTRKELEESAGYIIDPEQKDIDYFLSKLPYPLTGAQTRVVSEILESIKTGIPMSRLVEGDVGSGKTAVAALLCYLATRVRPRAKQIGKIATAGTLQVVYMAPTEILARQHFESFIKYFEGTGLYLGLITGSGCLKYPSKVSPGTHTTISRSQLSKWVQNGEISIVIGTHALIQKNVAFKHLGLCIIDEQHRFGVKQRKALVDKRGTAHPEIIPHLLTMTATPIPRTLALTIYGDLELSVLDQMPPGRKQIETTLVPPTKRDETYAFVQQKLREGRQVYVICPRVDDNDPESSEVKSVMSEAKRLQKDVFPDYKVMPLHGKMKPVEKEKIMSEFVDGKIDVLVATSVIEVGVSVANASIIIIEGGDRFGLAQLHQLRGRVLRGTHDPYCFIFTENNSEKTTERLKAIVSAQNGFELAEMDLMQRGAGGLTQGKQWGMSDIAMEAIKNRKLVEIAREKAQQLVKEGHELGNYPELKNCLNERDSTHLE